MINRKLQRQLIGASLTMVFLLGCNPPAAPQTPSAPTNTPVKLSTSTPAPREFNASVEIIGEEEAVYTYATDRCADAIVPDLPVRAFRDADGMVQLNLSSPTNYRMIGPDLDSLQLDCAPTMISDVDTDPSHYNFKEWMGSTYTTDGETVHALIHNEFHGSGASTWFAFRDFFDSEQGANNWHYQSWNGSSYRDMVFSAQADRFLDRWQGPQPLCQLFYWGAHPDNFCDPTRTWISPVAETVTVTGRVSDSDPGGGDGVIVTLLKEDEELWSETIENGNQEGFSFSLDLPVQVGDALHFRVNARDNADNDSTPYEFEINVGPDPCSPDSWCDHTSITYAVSTDGGKTFTQPPAPDHLVATLPYQFQPNWGLFANWQPSNIVKSPIDDYYYALLELDIVRSGEDSWFQGTCVMRTKNLADPKSWRAWDGEAFNMRFINPYLEPDAVPEEHTCQIVPVSTFGALSYNLTYSTFFEAFMAVGHVVNHPVTGFYFSLSEDLIQWTPVQLLMEADFVQTTDGPFLAYPSLIDPDSPSQNFDVTGQSPYLYFSRFQRAALEDIDLSRIRIQFSK